MSKPFALIVDDHGDSAIIFSEALKAAGFEFEVAHAGDAALARLAEVTPDVIVLDICLPRVAGTDLLRYIRADSRLAQAYVIVVTADPSGADAVRGRADQTLIKPIGFRWLRDLARQLVDRC